MKKPFNPKHTQEFIKEKLITYLREAAVDRVVTAAAIDIAHKMGVSETAVAKCLRAMVSSGEIEKLPRVGSAKGAYRLISDEIWMGARANRGENTARTRSVVA